MRLLNCPKVCPNCEPQRERQIVILFTYLEYKDLEARVDALRTAHIALLK